MAFYIIQISRNFCYGVLKEEDGLNADKIHFSIHFHNNRTLKKRGDTSVKYADFVSGDESMTLMVILGGRKDEFMGVPILSFKNSNRSCLIR